MTQEKKTETFDLDKILAEVKDKVAKRNGWNDWVDLVHWHQSNELEREVKEDYVDEVVTVAIASIREEFGKLLNQQGIVMQRKIKELEEQVEAQRKLIDSLDEANGARAALGLENDTLRDLLGRAINCADHVHSMTIREIRNELKALNPQDNQKEK